MLIESPNGKFAACLQSVGTVMFLYTWFPTQGDVESYPHIELMSCQHWNPHKIEFPQKKSVQEEVDGQILSKVKICLSRKTPGDTDRTLYGYNRGDFRSHSKDLFVHSGIDEFHRRLVAGVAVTATHVSDILTVNRDQV